MELDQTASWCGLTGSFPIVAVRQVRKERDLLQARLETAEAELERERGLHRRELRRKAKETQEVSEQLCPISCCPLDASL